MRSRMVSPSARGTSGVSEVQESVLAITEENQESEGMSIKDADCKEDCPVCPECGEHMEPNLLPNDDSGHERLVCTDCGAWKWL